MYDNIPRHKVFISYHHSNDQAYKDDLIQKFSNSIFLDMSVDTGDIDENLSDEAIRVKIRDEYLSDSTVTIVLVGTETKNRKHVDWEIYSSMYDGARNKKSGILIVNLPSVSGSQISFSDDDKQVLGPEIDWSPINSYDRYNYLPERLVENLKSGKVKMIVADYDRIRSNPEGLKKLIDLSHDNRLSNDYNLSDPMRRRNG